MNYSKIRQNPKQFETLTSLRVEEFDEILPAFEIQFNKANRQKTTRGTIRLNKIGVDKKLPTAAENLFFITTYLKLNPLQEHHAASFDISQPKVSKLIYKNLEVFNLTLKNLGYVPCRTSSEFKRFIEVRRSNNQDEHFFIDASERKIQRPVNQADQKEVYSRKKKLTT